MAETIASGKRSQKEDIFVHHFFYGDYHRGKNMVVHSLTEIKKCPTCSKQEELRQKQIVALKQQREQIKKLTDLIKHTEFVITRLDPIIRCLISETNLYISKDVAGRQIRSLSVGLQMKTASAKAVLAELEAK